jgi:hypothetical protein
LIKSRGKLVFRRGKWDWRSEFEERISKDDEIVLLALGDVKYEVLSYLNSIRDLEIVKLETRHLKKREKGLGLKAIVRKHAEPKLSF